MQVINKIMLFRSLDSLFPERQGSEGNKLPRLMNVSEEFIKFNFII